MFKSKRLLISPFIGRGILRRSFLLGFLLCGATWSALICWRTARLDLLPPARERVLAHFRRSRRLDDYFDDDSTPLIAPQSGRCSSQNSVSIVALVTSSPRNQQQRHAVRNTWGSELPTYFILGRTGSGPLNADEDMMSHYVEAKSHGDMIVGDFVDSYENLTLKTALMMRWAERECPRATFLLKTDDDVLINPWALRRLVKEQAGKDLIGYKLENGVPHRDVENKWFMPRWLYRPDLIPEYLSGTAYLVNGNHLSSINEASRRVPLINLEDVFLTYLVAKDYLNLTLTHDKRLSPFKPIVSSACALKDVASIHSLKPETITHIWTKLRALVEDNEETKHACSWFETLFRFVDWELFYY